MNSDEELLLSDAREDMCPLWEAAWALKDRHRAEQAIRSLIEQNLVSLYRCAYWTSNEYIPLNAEEHLHGHFA
jgi:hypothetical protein